MDLKEKELLLLLVRWKGRSGALSSSGEEVALSSSLVILDITVLCLMTMIPSSFGGREERD
jgi:hypothetical protein